MAHTSTHPILLVDDDLDLLSLMKLSFEREGYTVHACSSAPDRAEIESWDPAVIFMDVNLSSENGAALCSAIKRDAHSAHWPVILISGHADEILHQEAASGLADACVTKPFHMRSLLSWAAYYAKG